MKHHFKVGDRVQLIDDNGGYGEKGDTGSVIYVTARDVDVVFDAGTKADHGGCRTWFCGPDNLKTITKPTLATDLSFKPSTRRILAHLKSRGSITVLEAIASYGVSRIAPAIHDLRSGGYGIKTVTKNDAGGHKYTRYILEAA